MGNLNYIGTIVKLLEVPSSIQLILIKKKKLNFEDIESLFFITFRVQLACPQIPSIATLQVWGPLAFKIVEAYRIDDYMLIEGHVNMKILTKKNYLKKKVVINIEKIFPIVLDSLDNERFV